MGAGEHARCIRVHGCGACSSLFRSSFQQFFQTIKLLRGKYDTSPFCLPSYLRTSVLSSAAPSSPPPPRAHARTPKGDVHSLAKEGVRKQVEAEQNPYPKCGGARTHAIHDSTITCEPVFTTLAHCEFPPARDEEYHTSPLLFPLQHSP